MFFALKFTLRRLLGLSLAAMLLIGLSLQSAAAQGLLDSLVAGSVIAPARELPPQAAAYAPPLSLSAPTVPAQAPEAKFTRETGGQAYCVRLCDGRYFPLARNAALSPAEACRSFCPAARTKVFYGATINQAAAADGSRYAALDTALLYRKRLVSGCTCNGRDAFGVARMNIASDPTLRAGDIVAGKNGFATYAGGRTTIPIAQSAGVSADLRQKLAQTRIYSVPQAEPVVLRAGHDKFARRDDRRAQLSR
jgi:hypothetical protein